MSQDLVRRFDKHSFYSVEQVTLAVERGGYSAAFIAYAHAAFCKQADFDAYYGPLGVVYSYQKLHRTIAKRYLSGQMDFDAEMIIYKFRRGDFSRDDFYESGIGPSGGGAGL